jgi:hypothetical protein
MFDFLSPPCLSYNEIYDLQIYKSFLLSLLFWQTNLQNFFVVNFNFFVANFSFFVADFISVLYLFQCYMYFFYCIVKLPDIPNIALFDLLVIFI